MKLNILIIFLKSQSELHKQDLVRAYLITKINGLELLLNLLNESVVAFSSAMYNCQHFGHSNLRYKLSYTSNVQQNIKLRAALKPRIQRLYVATALTLIINENSMR